jgi:membrane protein implicated in regulation of membrane protease activity
MKTGTQLIITGMSLGLVTGICFLLLLGAAVGIGMSGGLNNPDAVIAGFWLAAGISLCLVLAGIYLNIRRRSETDSNAKTNNKKAEQDVHGNTH